ncbi:MAG: helix-turn-helix transcriptional regulator [bacterium]|nr:helix-turn-helix transcriptional regulator [bacterium]
MKKLEYTLGSGNVFKDLGLPNAEELLAKAELVHAITCAIEDRNLTQQQAARIAGTSQAKISDMVRGQFDQFTIDRLIKMLMAFDQDVRIELAPKPRSRARATMTVATA